MFLLSSMVLASCIKDEALNSEADIEYCIIRDTEVLLQPSDSVYGVGTETNLITIKVKANSDLSRMSPEFLLTEGATINPQSGTVLDFSNTQEQEYVVTSEDGEWQKTYVLRFKEPVIPTVYNFENYEIESINGKYYRFYEQPLNENKEYMWSSGNAGFMIAKSSALPSEYPTAPYEFGRTGACVKLETKDVGEFGAMVGMRIAAGNIFIGEFDIMNATSKPVEATKFGVPFCFKPKQLNGWFKYKAGDKLQDAKGNELVGVDRPDIYAVLYENTSESGDKVVLNGSNILSSQYVVAVARASEITNTDEWTEFSLPFSYLKDVDQERLNVFGYNITVVFSSSVDGGSFIGAVGSTLLVDDVELLY